ncbi:hypothetical protein F441_00860 [Phytophthora nicotianae CJ01A1]|uniref:Uncharacterized protein n=3 Tax=Phytophthora nicotianae TaxID=4792 RepID=W3A7G5_PHYNI|nr:hypothetical protein L915_00825 [Phytophthora nicotianae]ETL49822.1 hypothetical protein L916_00815 [Phytophthora nicotianae]ETM56116.1 hypothetical protein L914_00813 [Phytophthora nicotianae]ETP26472.1 hypothetical protein F441_00860 [Phytophthora nicotianae CJ01A1]ETP54469.1 hypothetical protein F442_00838 [Phytophthora nicotianae P10297]
MDTLQVQKENVDANLVGNGATGKLHFGGTNKLSTPKRSFVIHDDSKSTGQKELKDRSTKSRRVLGDISNKQRGCHKDSNAAGIASTKKGLGGHPKKLSSSRRTPLTPLRSKSGALETPKARASLTPKVRATLISKGAIKTPRAEKVPDIEFAYGGLSSPKADSAYMKDLGDEIWRDILNDETPTLFDDFDLTRAVDAWDDSREKAMLESGEPPSLWWASPDLQTKKETGDSDTKQSEKEEEQDDDLNDLPPPDNLREDSVADLDNDGLLEDLLSVDVEAVCSE